MSVALLALLLTEYGLQTRAVAIDRLVGSWRPGRTLLRLTIWVLAWIGSHRTLSSAAVLGMGFLLCEAAAIWLRRSVRTDAKNGHAHGRPTAHLIPLAAGLVVAIAFLAARRLGIADPGLARTTLALWASAFLALWAWATLVTVSVVDLARPDLVRDDESRQMGPGEVIGILERLVTFALVVSGALPTVGFVIAAKAAARFPLFKEKAFAEYFLIGTLTSVGLALLCGLLVAATSPWR